MLFSSRPNKRGNTHIDTEWSLMTPVQRFQVSLSTGGVLDVGVSGPKDRTPMMFHHGTPLSLILFEPFVDAVVSRGLRYVSYSRPGYGDSTRKPGRTIADCSKDTEAVLDQLRADRFYAIGWSGGGPHALACAALLPRRVIAATTIAGPVPPSSNLDWLSGMGKENVEEFTAALAGPDELRTFLERAAFGLAQVTGEQIISAFGELVSDLDKATLSRGFGTFVAGNIREALRNGFWGWLDDDLAFTRDWGFDLNRISVPVNVWHGSKDRMVPFEHGRWLAEHLPGARAHLLPEHGHFSLVLDQFGEILDDLIASGKC